MASRAVLDLIANLKDNASAGMASIGDAAGKLGLIAGGVAVAGVAALGMAVAGGIGDAREAARLYASTEQTILTMGNAAGRSADQVVDLASSLSDAAGASLFGDDQVQQAENLLLTFGEIKGETFDLATALTVDLAQALGGAPADQAMMLGKALNDPITGLTALGRAGLTFSEEQKAVIAALQESGDMAGAQAIIIAELNKQVGGQAQAAADASGGWSEFQGRLGEAAETVGGALLPIIAQLGGFLLDVIVPAVESAAGAFSAWLADPAVQAGIQQIGDAITTGLGAAMAFLTDTAIPALLAGWALIKPAIDLILPLFSGEMPAALGATGETFTLLGETVQAIMALISGIIAVAIPAMIRFWEDHGEQITRIVKASFDLVVSVINAALTLIKGIITVALDVINGDWEGAWKHLQEMSADFVLAIGDVIKKFLDLIASYFNTSLSEIAKVWTDNWNQLVDIATNTDWAQVGQDVVDGILSGLRNSWSSLTSWVSDKVGDLVNSALEAIGAGSPAVKFMPVGQFAVMGIIQGFADAWPGLQAAIGDMGDKMIDQAQRIAQMAQRALGAAFAGEASIDRQVAANLDKLKDVLPQYLAYTQGALAQVQREAEAMLDPAQGARYFKMRSDQILEYAKLQKDLSEAATQQDRERIAAQMLLINQAQTAEIAAFNAIQAGQAAPIAAMADEIKKMMDAITAQLMSDTSNAPPNEAALATLAQLAALYDMLNNAPGRAIGGSVAANEPYWVGERGRELFVPQTSGAIVPAGAGAGMTMPLTFYITGNDPEQIANRVLAKIDARLKGRR